MLTFPHFMPGLNGPAPKIFRDGTHRVCVPEETLARVRPFMPIMGITRIANITGLDCIGIPVMSVSRPNARSLATAQGKGLQLAAAKVSGLMEAVEVYHAEHILAPLKLGSYEELRYTHRVVNVTALPGVVGSRFHPTLRLLWIEGYDLLQDEHVWVPYELVHTDYTLPLPTGSGCFPMTSNGLASGNHPIEAISHGICEVIERDATTLWSLRDQVARQRTRLDLTSVDHPDCQAVLAQYAQANIGVAVWETTTDVNLPAFLCTIIERMDDPWRPLPAASGMGCHPTRHIALLRALTEAAQSRLTLITGARDDAPRAAYDHACAPEIRQQYRAQMEVHGPLRRFQDVPTWETETLHAEVDGELARLLSIGITRVIIVDLTRPEFHLPVVRVIIPGLEGAHQAPRFLPGARARACMEGRL